MNGSGNCFFKSKINDMDIMYFYLGGAASIFLMLGLMFAGVELVKFVMMEYENHATEDEFGNMVIMPKKPRWEYKFESYTFVNRWQLPAYARPERWVILGIMKRWSKKRWSNMFIFGYSIHFFGFDFYWWFKKEVKQEKEN